MMDPLNLLKTKARLTAPAPEPGMPPLPLDELILNHGYQGTAILDQDHRCLYLNREMTRILGRPPHDILGRDLREYLNIQDQKHIRDDQPTAMEVLATNSEQTPRTVEVRHLFAETTEGKTLRIVLASDITHHAHMRRDLLESERQYRLLVENIEEFFFEQTIEGGFHFFNEAMVRHSGFTRDELSAMTFKDYILPEDWDRVVNFYSTILQTGEPASGLLIRGRMKDGSIHYYNVKSNLKTDATGRKIGFRSYCRDVTAEILYERELKAKVEERTRELKDINTALEVLLKKRERDKRELEERVAFSIKEVIAPHLELLKKTSLDKHQAYYLDILEQSFQEICSPFMHILSDSLQSLTSTEIQVVNLIKQNKSTKQIADFLGVSSRTVEFHRDNIRTKMGIKNKKINLRAFLLSSRPAS
jgi:PAS domain S-box-containing protein